MDSEDEAYLSERPHIEPRVLERIFDTLEAQSSDNNICWPETARAVLTSKSTIGFPLLKMLNIFNH